MTVWQRAHLNAISEAKSADDRKELRQRADLRIGALGSGTEARAMRSSVAGRLTHADGGVVDKIAVLHLVRHRRGRPVPVRAIHRGPGSGRAARTRGEHRQSQNCDSHVRHLAPPPVWLVRSSVCNQGTEPRGRRGRRRRVRYLSSILDEIRGRTHRRIDADIDQIQRVAGADLPGWLWLFASGIRHRTQHADLGGPLR